MVFFFLGVPIFHHCCKGKWCHPVEDPLRSFRKGFYGTVFVNPGRLVLCKHLILRSLINFHKFNALWVEMFGDKLLFR